MSQPTDAQQKELMEKLKNMSPEELREFQKKQCIFCQIISGKVDGKKIYGDDKAIAILDINPASPGHILLMPKEHYAIMPQIPDEEIYHLGILSKKLSHAVLKGLKVQGTTIFVANGLAAGQRAQHFMMHIIPRVESDNVLSSLPQKSMSDDQLQQLQTLLLKQVKKALDYVPTKKDENKVDEKTSHKSKVEQPEVEEEVVEEVLEEQEDEEKVFITSHTAKRYHVDTCPFAQKIGEDRRIVLTKEDMIEGGRKPCSCTGEKSSTKKSSSKNKDKKKSVKKKIVRKKTKKKVKEEDVEKSQPEEATYEDDADESVGLDDIANLFG